MDTFRTYYERSSEYYEELYGNHILERVFQGRRTSKPGKTGSCSLPLL